MEKFKYILKEITDTEDSYCKDMRNLIEMVFKPLVASSTSARNAILPAEIIYTIFPKELRLMAITSQKFFKDLISIDVTGIESDVAIAEKVTRQIRDVFQKYSTEFAVYSIYCSTYEKNIENLKAHLKSNKKFSNFMSSALAIDKERTRGLDLSSFLIKPVQRICKYPLFLRELLKLFPESSIDEHIIECREYLQRAWNVADEVVTAVNESMRESSSQMALQKLFLELGGLPRGLISPHRRVLHSCDCKASTAKTMAKAIATKPNGDYSIHLLSDLLLISARSPKTGVVGEILRRASWRKSSKDTGTLQLKASLPYDSVAIADAYDGNISIIGTVDDISVYWVLCLDVTGVAILKEEVKRAAHSSTPREPRRFKISLSRGQSYQDLTVDERDSPAVSGDVEVVEEEKLMEPVHVHIPAVDPPEIKDKEPPLLVPTSSSHAPLLGEAIGSSETWYATEEDEVSPSSEAPLAKTGEVSAGSRLPPRPDSGGFDRLVRVGDSFLSAPRAAVSVASESVKVPLLSRADSSVSLDGDTFYSAETTTTKSKEDDFVEHTSLTLQHRYIRFKAPVQVSSLPSVVDGKVDVSIYADEIPSFLSVEFRDALTIFLEKLDGLEKYFFHIEPTDTATVAVKGFLWLTLVTVVNSNATTSGLVSDKDAWKGLFTTTIHKHGEENGCKDSLIVGVPWFFEARPPA